MYFLHTIIFEKCIPSFIKIIKFRTSVIFKTRFYRVFIAINQVSIKKNKLLITAILNCKLSYYSRIINFKKTINKFP